MEGVLQDSEIGWNLDNAGEVKPKQPLKRAIYTALRLPLALITYIISQTGTKAVGDINTEIRKAGFEIANERKSFLGSFVTIVAKKLKTPSATADAQAMKPGDDK